MENNQTNSLNNSFNDINKDTNFQAQKKLVFDSFKEMPKTMLMVSIETGILRANICRYVAEWQKKGRIKLLGNGHCKVSKHLAGYYTTNPELFPAIVEPLNPKGNE